MDPLDEVSCLIEQHEEPDVVQQSSQVGLLGARPLHLSALDDCGSDSCHLDGMAPYVSLAGAPGHKDSRDRYRREEFCDVASAKPGRCTLQGADR